MAVTPEDEIIDIEIRIAATGISSGEIDDSRLASPETVTEFLVFDVRRCLSILARGSAFGARQSSVAGLED
jgi:hypothetical protein